uniref:Uncharacterized protein n=1 Tax=Timema tahoe TaxID=61484 RepID=A0A7R9IIS8_9NEOP|nr:unnamed protein product [Timema tahoe]
MENHLGKTTPSSPDRDLNLDLLVLGSLALHDTSQNVLSEAKKKQIFIFEASSKLHTHPYFQAFTSAGSSLTDSIGKSESAYDSEYSESSTMQGLRRSSFGAAGLSQTRLPIDGRRSTRQKLMPLVLGLDLEAPFLCLDAYDSDPNLVTYPLRSTVSRKAQKLDNLVKDTAQSQKIAFSTRTQSKVTLSRPTPDRDPTPTYHSIDNPACHKHNSLDSVSTDASSPSVECLDC